MFPRCPHQSTSHAKFCRQSQTLPVPLLDLPLVPHHLFHPHLHQYLHCHLFQLKMMVLVP